MVDKVSVMEEDWDYLIIIDACRYDYFSAVYRDYLRGNLQKHVSLGSTTIEWCKKSFRKRYDDVVYISANPWINSKVEVEGFTARKHFHRVIDVWPVHPEEVNKAVEKFKDDYPDKRFIIHYLQPHIPYLACEVLTPNSLMPKKKLCARRRLLSITGKSFLELLVFLTKRTGLFGERPSWKIRELLNLPPGSYLDAVRRKVGNSGLRDAYVQNLRLVLKYVARLVENLHGIIIITADHGERLGEAGTYGHPGGLSDLLLLEVPWFKVEKAARAKKHHKDSEKRRIKQRIEELRALRKL